MVVCGESPYQTTQEMSLNMCQGSKMRWSSIFSTDFRCGFNFTIERTIVNLKLILSVVPISPQREHYSKPEFDKAMTEP